MEIFEKRLKQAMFIRRVKQAELSEMTGLKEGKISSYVNGKYKPNAKTLSIIAKALDVSPEWLIGIQEEPQVLKARISDTLKNDPDIPFFSCSEEENRFLEKYRAIDQRGRNAVDYILDEEYYRCQLEETVEYNDDIVPMRYAGQRAAAGRWIFDENVPTEMVLVKPKEGADFVIGISGDSMEPDYCDGDKVYIKRTTDLIFGEVGLFQIGDEYYIKELTPEGLRSVNPKYAVIPKSENIIVIGKVLGKAKEKKRWTPEKKQRAK